MNLFSKYHPFLFMLSGFYIGDCVTTWIGIQFFGMYEINPIARSIIDITGTSLFGIFICIALYKTAGLAITLSVVDYYSKNTVYSNGDNYFFALWEYIYRKVVNIKIFLYFFGIIGYIASIWNISKIIGVI